MLTAVDDLFRRSITTLVAIYLVVGIAVIVGLVFIIRELVRTYLQYRGKRLVICPETEKYATVEIDAPLAAVTSQFGAPELRIENCSRWPERQHCAQDCMWQIDLSPLGCPIRDLSASWYMGKACVLCGRPFGNFSSFDRPALLSPEGNVVECKAVRPEAIPDVLVHPQTRVLGLQRERETVWALGDGRETASAPVDSQTMTGMEVMIRWQHPAYCVWWRYSA